MKWWVLFMCGCCFPAARLAAQRVYAPHSVLASGNWYRIGVKQEGVYRIDLAQLSALGIPTANLASASIRLYGNGGGMLDENNVTPRPDDLIENAIEMADGGDGIFNGSDYFLFYAPGPQRWSKDSAALGFRHRKNLFSDTAYYFITIGGTGKRIAAQAGSPAASVSVNTFNERYFYENDLVNLLNSGKEWLGEEFNTNLGGNASRNFPVDGSGWVTTQPITVVTSLAARSVGAPAVFSVKLNGQTAHTANLPGVTGGLLDAYVTALEQRSTVQVTQGPLALNITYAPTTPGSQGWLNWFELMGRKTLAMNANAPLFFRDWSSVAPGAVAGFSIAGSSAATAVWDVTDPLQPVKMNVNSSGTQTLFSGDASRLHEYVAFTAAQAQQAIPLGKINNQDLHGTGAADLIIITHNSLLTEAQRLAQFHMQRDGYRVLTVTTDQVYNEFSGGTPDPAALRDFVKMFVDRSAGDPSRRPKHLLLFGSGSYDYRYRSSGNANLVPVYESQASFSPLLSFTSDDFFGLLDDGEDINANDPSHTLDIGIGRIPARSTAEAKTMVDKIIRYHDSSSFGPWRNQSVYVADDQDANLHLDDAETVVAAADAANPLLNPYKIYLDAYPLVSSSAGARYPAVNDAIVNQVFNGALILNYTGHGSYQRLAEEAILTQAELNRFNNPGKLPLFITASCDFAPHDDPAKSSLGAGILTGSANGAIALVTTTRLVFANSNRQLNDNYVQVALRPQSDGSWLTLGQSIQQAKNYNVQTGGDVINNRKFTLLGDPAMRIALPALRLQLTELNGTPITGSDTLRALQKYTFTGQVTDAVGNAVTGFNGTVYPTVYDKKQVVKTLGNDPSSPVTNFDQQASVLYKGNATVTNGRFSFTFIVPKDINYKTGPGRISLYAENGLRDAGGVNTNFFVGGAGNAVITDQIGPTIQPFLNDDRFMDGGLTHENPILLVKLYDSSGISTSGNGIGHDITAVIDGDEWNILVLNNFYTAAQDSYQRGQVLMQLPTLTEGPHTIRIKAWDVANNSSEVTLHFVVAKQELLAISHVRNYPNPFSVSTTFAFEHNQPATDLAVTIRIWNSSGALVREIRKTVNTGGTRNVQVNWSGDSQSGAKLAKGVYIYKIMVAAGGARSESAQQLIVF